MTTTHPETDADYRPKVNRVIVVQKAGDTDYRLRVYLDAGRGGIICFETPPSFSKCEADYRAMLLTSGGNLGCDELPTRPYRMPYPKVGP